MTDFPRQQPLIEKPPAKEGDPVDLLAEGYPSARELGIQSYSVTPINAPGVKLPPNLYRSSETDAAAAALDMFMALNTHPHNCATWDVPDSLFPRELREEIAHARKADPKLFRFFSYGTIDRDVKFPDIRTPRDEIADIIVRFKECSSRIHAAQDPSLAKRWLEASLAVLEKFSTGIPDAGMMAYFNFSSNGKRDIGDTHLTLHTDGGEHNPKAVEETDIRIESRNLRFLWTQNDIGVYCADIRDTSLYSQRPRYAIDNKRTNPLSFRFTKPEPLLYAAAPWSITLINNNTNTNPAIHATPVKRNGEDLERFLWDFRLITRAKLTAKDNQDWKSRQLGQPPYLISVSRLLLSHASAAASSFKYAFQNA